MAEQHGWNEAERFRSEKTGTDLNPLSVSAGGLLGLLSILRKRQTIHTSRNHHLSSNTASQIRRSLTRFEGLDLGLAAAPLSDATVHENLGLFSIVDFWQPSDFLPTRFTPLITFHGRETPCACITSQEMT